MMSLGDRKGVLLFACIAISCLLVTLYSTWSYCEEPVVYIGVAHGHGNVEYLAVKRGVRVPVSPCVLPQSNVTRTQVVNISTERWNVFDTQESRKYTIVVQTYRRNDLLKRFLKRYNHKSFPSLEQIIVLWNNIGVPLQPTMFEKEISQAAVPVRFLVSKTNSLRNKLQPYPQIQTSAVLLLDDDILIAASDVEFAFQTWQQFPQRIVGFVPRKHVFEPDGTISENHYDWKKGVPNVYSVVLTDASFVHKDYLKMFNETVSREIHEWIDHKMNCEDLALNVMVGDYLAGIGMPQPSSVCVAQHTPIQFIESQAKSGFLGLSKLPHFRKERCDCFKKLNSTYHGLPLPFSNLIVSKLKS